MRTKCKKERVKIKGLHINALWICAINHYNLPRLEIRLNMEKKYALFLASLNSGGYFNAVFFAALFYQITPTVSSAPLRSFQYHTLIFMPIVFVLTYVGNKMRRQASDKALLTFFSILIPCFLVSIFFFGPIPNLWVLGLGAFTGFTIGYSSFYRNFPFDQSWVLSKEMAIEAKIELIKIEYESYWHTLLIFVTIMSAVYISFFLEFQTTLAPMFKEPQTIELLRAGVFIGLGYEVAIFVLVLLRELLNRMSRVFEAMKEIKK